MKRFIITALLGMGFCSVALASPLPVYTNPSPNTNTPTIDAIVFVNNSLFETFTDFTISNSTGNVPNALSSLPYSTSDTLYFTNTINGTMEGVPGFLFDTATATTRKNAKSFVNDGSIVSFDVEAEPFLFSTPGGKIYTPDVADSQPLASQLQIFCNDILNDGTISVGNYGLLQMVGQNITNANGMLVAGALNTGGVGNFFFSTNIFGGIGGVDPIDTTGGGDLFDEFDDINFYVNPPGVYDLFWGVTNGATLALNKFFPPQTTPIGVLSRNGESNTLELPLNFNPDFATFVYTNTPDGTNIYFNIVFVNTNFYDVNGQPDSNITASVQFSPEDLAFGTAEKGDINAYMAMVQFALTVPDVISGEVVTNAVYLLDDGANFSSMTEFTNTGSANNYNRPDAFVITTDTPNIWEPQEFAFFYEANYPYDPSLIYAANTYSSESVTFNAAAYGVQIGRNPAQLDGSFNFITPFIFTNSGTNEIFNGVGDVNEFEGIVTLPDPTNEAPRIELTANQLDLSNARLRSEGLVAITATNLVGTTAGSDWGEINAQLGAASGFMIVSNFFPTNYQRLRGDIYAWSANWENTITNGLVFGIGTTNGITNTYHYHLLVVDQNLGGNFQSAIRNLSLTGTDSINVQDSLYVINQDYFNSRELIFNSNVVFTQNAGNLTPANMPALKYFLNNSNANFSVDGLLDMGYNVSKGQTSPSGRNYTVTSIANLGSITATTPSFQSEFFENDGSIVADNSGSIIIEAGNIGLGLVLTNTYNELLAEGSVTLSAVAIGVSNSLIFCGSEGFESIEGGGGLGRLLLQTTSDGQITDFVPNTPATNSVLDNFWQVTDGFSLPVKPAIGDLFGTEIETIATNTTIALHTWAGADLGPVADGFADNVVIGHLLLSWQSPNALLHFTGAGARNGMYVDYLDFDTNSLYQSSGAYRNGLVIDPNLTIYFAAASVDPVKLTNVYPGRLVWVTNFAGPNSTTLVTNELNPSQVCAINADVADSPDPGLAFFPPTLNSDNQPYPLNNPTNGAWYFGTNGCPVILAVGNSNFTSQTFASIKGVYSGLFYDTNQISSANSGFFTFTLSPKGAFTGRLMMGPAVYAFNGSGPSKFNSSGAAQVIAKHGNQSLTVNLQLADVAGGTSSQVTGSVSNETWVAPLQGYLKPVWKANNPSPYAGSYTMVLTNGGTNSVPGGDSYGSLTVSKLGVLSVAGNLADGNPFSQSVPISQDGLWPFYTYVAGGGDFLSGWIAFQDNILLNNAAIGATNVFWSKAPSAKARYYPAGFTLTNVNLAVSPYANPGKDFSGLNLVDPIVILSGGDLVEPLTNLVAYNGKLSYLTNNLTLSINPAAGSFTGRFQTSEDGPFIKLSGVVLQNQDSAFGFFLGTNKESGAVLLQSQ